MSIGWSSVVVAGLTLASRLVGLVRVRIFASHFGAGQILDTYYASFRIPDFLMGVLIVGTLSIAVLPVFAEAMLKSRARAERLVGNLLNITLFGMLVVCVLVGVAAPWLVHVIVPGFSAESARNVVVLTRLILCAQVLLSVGNVAATGLNAAKRFFWAGFAPITYNLGLIAGVVWFFPRFGLPGLGYGVIVGAVAHVCVQLIDLWRAGYGFRPVLYFDSDVRLILKLYIPRLFTLDLSQVSLLLASIFGSLLAVGSIAVFSLGFDIQAVPVGVFAFAIATASFPHLSDHFAQKQTAAFIALLRQATLRILFFMLPITIWLLLLRAHAVRILYGAGHFSWDDTRATFNVLGILAFSLVGQALVPLFSRALLARHNTWAPVMANILSIVVDIVVSLLLVPKYGIVGVAAGYAIAMSFNAILLYAWLRPDLAAAVDGHVALVKEEYVLVKEVWKVLFATTLLAFATYAALYAVAPLVNTRTWLGIVIQSGVAVLAGGFIYVIASLALGLSDARNVAGIIGKIFMRVAPKR
jgi:putative peptidoglycan lipid II flippase